MSGIDKAAGRMAALIVLLALGAAALRGYVPEKKRSEEPSPDSPASLVLVAALLGVTLAIIAVALVARLRDRRAVAGNFAGIPEGPVGRQGRLSRRTIFVVVGVTIVFVVAVWLLAQLVGRQQLELVAPPPESDTTPATDTATPPTDAPQPQPQTGGDAVGYLAAGAVAMLVLTFAGIVVGVVKRRRVTQPLVVADDHFEPAASSAGPESLARAAELGLAEIGDRDRGPREAIIACYAAMERELAHVPDVAPQAFDTPTEVLTRAVAHHALQADNAAQLVALFAEARFSPHVMNETHRNAAVRVLRLVLDELSPHTDIPRSIR
jgi:uncharacterized membrane protein YhaH (DUF805 family)